MQNPDRLAAVSCKLVLKAVYVERPFKKRFEEKYRSLSYSPEVKTILK